MQYRGHIVLSILILFLVLLVFEYIGIDLLVQNQLYDFSEKIWLLSPQRNPIIHFVFYDGIKIFLVLFELTLLLVLLFFKNKRVFKNRVPGLCIVFFSLLIVPSTVAAIKASSNIACPKDLRLYNGTIPYVHLFEANKSVRNLTEPQKCFPAAHASSGFALLSLIFIARTKRRRKQLVILSLSVGWSMGLYKMLIGHHFLSHTVVSMVLAWILIGAIALAVNSLDQYRRRRAETPSLVSNLPN